MRTTNVYQKYLQWHFESTLAHGGLTFLAWHRAFLWEFEEDLQAADKQPPQAGNGKLGIPWWDWTTDNTWEPGLGSSAMWYGFMGGVGRVGDGEVTSGPFTKAPWPEITVINREYDLPQTPEMYLRRNVGRYGPLPNQNDIDYLMRLKSVDVAPYLISTKDRVRNDPVVLRALEKSFRNVLEGGTKPASLSAFHHWSGHDWVNGSMSNLEISPYDPVFWSHHANVDRIWAKWQEVNTDSAQWPTDAEIAAAYPNGLTADDPVAKRNDLMVPWTGAEGTRRWTPAKVLKCQEMGRAPLNLHTYSYPTDADSTVQIK